MSSNETVNRKEIQTVLRETSGLLCKYQSHTERQIRKQKVYRILISSELPPSYITNWKKLSETGISIFFRSAPHYGSDSAGTLHPITTRTATTISLINSAQFPLVKLERRIIKIPAKVQYAISKYIPKDLLHGLSSFEEEAVELCLLFLSNLSNTGIIALNTSDEWEKQGWKHLKAKFLDEQLGGSNYTLRKKIVDLLVKGTKKGPIIELDQTYLQGLHSMSYRLAVGYFSKGIVSYEVKSDRVNNLIRRHQEKWEVEVKNNVIIKNLKCLYPFLKLPTTTEILTEARKLVDSGYHTKKGLKLTFLHKHSKNYFVNPKKLTFVEDCISIFDYLTVAGMIRPSISAKAGGRVTDALNLMPGWIRNLIRIDGERIREVDYTALHPNIAISLYSGTTHNISHKAVADQFGFPISTIKQEHLSFFNKNIFMMNKSPLFNFYSRQEPEMLKRIIDEKRTKGYKATTLKLFEKEVKIMADVIKNLNGDGIYVGYVYDALLCKESDTSFVLRTMNQIVAEHKVYTTAKVDEGIRIN